jgi:hydroxymethylglutaryl-CoA synthase
MAGIIGYGVYIPKYRLKVEDPTKVWLGGAAAREARGEKSVCAIDEDIVTMAVEAGEKAIKHAGVDPSEIGAIHIGTSSSPYIEKYVSPILAEALELHPETTMIDYCGSLNAAGMALLGCLDAIEAKRIKCGIVISSENRAAAPGSEGEVLFGAGATAFVVGVDGIIAEIEGTHTYSTSLTDRWRAASDPTVSNFFDYRFDREYGYQKHVVESTKGLMGKLERKSEDYSHVVFQQPDPRLPGLAARSLGIKREQLALGSSAIFFGDLGASSAFVGLAAVLDKAKPGERILLSSYGSGSSNAFSLIVRDETEKKRDRVVPVEKYLKRKEYIDYPVYLKWTEAIKRAPY